MRRNKNKYEEALDTLICKAHTDNAECFANRKTKDEICLGCDYGKAYDELCELVRKATPKKPKEWCVPDDFGFLLYKRCMCPNCYEEIAQVWRNEKGLIPYCPYCGQAIDWEK